MERSMIGRLLYERFFEMAEARGAPKVISQTGSSLSPSELRPRLSNLQDTKTSTHNRWSICVGCCVTRVTDLPMRMSRANQARPYSGFLSMDRGQIT